MSEEEKNFWADLQIMMNCKSREVFTIVKGTVESYEDLLLHA